MSGDLDCRALSDYWAVWAQGHEWPELFADEDMARERARHLAADLLGRTVHLLRFDTVGSIMFPNTPEISGRMVAAEKTR